MSTFTRSTSAVVAALGLCLLAACAGGGDYAATPLPVKTTAQTTTPPPGPPVPACDPLKTYDPLPSLPASGEITDGSVREILRKGHLTVGVSADTYLFGARDPFTGQLEGFDIDLAKAVAKSLFGDERKLQLLVITAGDRIPLLKSREIDMVARNMTMNCARWVDIAFSAEYYHSGQKVLVARGSTAQSLADLKGKRVCAPTGTTSLAKLREFSEVTAVTAANHTGCLVLFQQGKADAITGDDTVLAGLAAQDPYTVVTKAKAMTDEPYGLGFNKDDVYLVRYVNRLLADMVADGRWKAIYNKWLADPLGPAPAPPTPKYRR